MTEQASVPRPGGGTEDLAVTIDSQEDAGRLNGASTARLALILATLILFTEVAPLQVLMVSNLLPKIGAAFPASGNAATWTISIFGIVSGATIALVGKLGDVFGKKRTMLIFSVFFLAGALLDAVTTSWALFLVGRGVQAVCAGMAVINYGLVRDLMPRRWIPIAVSFIATGLGFSAIIGPLVGGVLTEHYSFRSAFWFLFIYMAVMIPLFALIVPESPLRARQRFDVLGALLFGAGIGLVVVYLTEGGSWGWTSSGNLPYLIGGLVALAAFVWWELRTSAPMIELSLLRAPGVALIVVAGLLATGVQAMIPALQAYLFETPPQAVLQQQVLAAASAQKHIPVTMLANIIHFRGTVSGSGYSPLQLAEHVSVWLALFIMIFGPVGGFLARRVGARIPLIAGTVAMAGGSALWIGWHSTWQEQVLIGLLYGLGTGFYLAAWPNVIIDAVPAVRQGIATGMVQVSGAIGVALFPALFASVLAAHPFQLVAVGQVHTIPQVYTDSAYSQGYLLLAVIPCVIAVVIGIVMRSGRTPARGGAPVGITASSE
jgi:MFS family permease